MCCVHWGIVFKKDSCARKPRHTEIWNWRNALWEDLYIFSGDLYLFGEDSILTLKCGSQHDMSSLTLSMWMLSAGQTFPFLFKNLWSSIFHSHIWLHHEKCIQMSTNKPSIGSVVLEKTLQNLRKNCQILIFLHYFSTDSKPSHVYVKRR